MKTQTPKNSDSSASRKLEPLKPLSQFSAVYCTLQIILQRWKDCLKPGVFRVSWQLSRWAKSAQRENYSRLGKYLYSISCSYSNLKLPIAVCFVAPTGVLLRFSIKRASEIKNRDKTITQRTSPPISCDWTASSTLSRQFCYASRQPMLITSVVW